MEGYYIQTGYMGRIGNIYYLFATEQEYYEIFQESEQNTS